MTANTPNYVQIPPQSSGLKIRTVEVTDSAGNTVEEQVIVIGDPVNQANLMSIGLGGTLPVTNIDFYLLLQQILAELRHARLIWEHVSGVSIPSETFLESGT